MQFEAYIQKPQIWQINEGKWSIGILITSLIRHNDDEVVRYKYFLLKILKQWHPQTLQR